MDRLISTYCAPPVFAQPLYQSFGTGLQMRPTQLGWCSSCQTSLPCRLKIARRILGQCCAPGVTSIRLLHDSALAAELRAAVQVIIELAVILNWQTGRAALFGAGDLVLQPCIDRGEIKNYCYWRCLHRRRQSHSYCATGRWKFMGNQSNSVVRALPLVL